ncbi:MAG TPA: FHA domain-containing protein [Polyangia bacterium]|nr:FHA domain-containing protein [Polyangia bacterium]
MSDLICPSCGATSPADYRFCGRCGAKLTDADGAPHVGKTMYFGAPEQPVGKARLIVIKGEGVDGISYHLSGSEHIAGRVEGPLLFAEDPLLSPRHANFFYRDGTLVVQDLGSSNGVFVRIRQPVTLESGGVFLVGEQLLQVEACAPDLGPQMDADGTVFYSSPKRPSKLQLMQRLRGGDIGMVFRSRADTLTIGREGNDLNFPDDPFISGHHAKVACADGGSFTLTDLGSKNGTFIRIAGEAALTHGDYVFIGQQLLRVEVS